MRRVAGIEAVTINGVRYDVKGSVTYNLGKPRREAVVGLDGVHGSKKVPQVPFCEATFTDRGDLDVGALLSTENATIVWSLSSGKTVVFNKASHAGEGTINPEEGEVPVRFEAQVEGEEI